MRKSILENIIFLLVLLLSPFASNAATDFESGRILLKNCNEYLKIGDGGTNPEYIFGAGRCLGLVRGMIDAAAVFDSIAVEKGKPTTDIFCVPDGVSTDQGVRVVIKYLNDNQKELHQRGTILIVLALMEAFPCE